MPSVSSVWPPKRSATMPVRMPLRAAYTAAAAPAGPPPTISTSKALPWRQLGGVARGGAGVDLGQDLGQLHAARAEELAVQEDRRHGHDLARFDLGLEQAAVDGHVADARVQHRHQVQRLHHVRAVVAGQATCRSRRRSRRRSAWICSITSASTLGGWPPACSSASTSEVNSWPIGMAAKRTPMSAPARLIENEGRRASLAVEAHAILSLSGADVVQQLAHLGRGRAVVERGDQLDRLRQRSR